ncbi:MAG: glycosyltransferase [Acidobacteria bacterium]|nr:glycosyltransferase [Acidobacteriota bacterium]
MIVLQCLAAALVVGASVFCVLALLGVRSYLRQSSGRNTEPVSILKPLRGVDLGLEDNLRSFFALNYPCFELVLTVQDASDPAFALSEKLIAAHPHVDARIVLTGAPEWHNAKVWQMHRAWGELKYSLIVTSDSDIRVAPDFLRGLGDGFDVGTCPYRAIGGPSLWSRLEALGMNTEFLAGLVTARLLEGVKFAIGPTMYLRRGVIEAIGGWQQLSEYLAEDFVIGNRAAEKGFQVGLSRQLVEHRIGSEPMAVNFGHRLRWYRSTRRSRPAGYVGQLFTMPVPLILFLLAVAPQWWPLAAVAALLRLATAMATLRVVGAPLALFDLLTQDLLSFVFWLAGFFGTTIDWRGRKYVLSNDGRFTRLTD